MAIQWIIVSALVVISTVSLVINLGLWSDLKQAQADLSDTEAAAAFYERECEYERQEMEAAICIIREMQEDLAFTESDLQAARHEIESLHDLLAAIEHAHDITADIWYVDVDQDRPF